MGVLAGDRQPAAATRSGGGYEEIELFGGQEELFGVRHMPAPGPAVALSAPAGVVVCSPTWTDAEVNAERELRLANRLADAGMVVQRLSYGGIGVGAHGPGSAGLDALVQDVRAAVEHLADRCGVERVGLVGTRVGALVAAQVARHLPPGTPMALWQPVLDARRYLADAAAAASAVATRADEPHAAHTLLRSRLGRDLFSPVVAASLVDLLGPRPRPLLLVQLHRRVGLAPEYRDAVGRLEAQGFTVDVAYDPTEEEWWQVGAGREPSDEVLAVTAEWLGRQLS